MFFQFYNQVASCLSCGRLLLEGRCQVVIHSRFEIVLRRRRSTTHIANFTKNVYKTLSTDPAYKNENLILSPLSIHSALSMLYYGSPIQTTTNLELTKLLGLNLQPIKSFRNGKYHFLNLFRYYEKSGKEHNAEVSLANRIYLQERVL